MRIIVDNENFRTEIETKENCGSDEALEAFVIAMQAETFTLPTINEAIKDYAKSLLKE